MDRRFPSLLLTGNYGVSDGNFPPRATSDETYINQEIISQTRTHEKSVLPSLNLPYSPETLFNFNPPTAYQLPELRSIERVNHEDRRLKQKLSPVATATTQYTLDSLTANYFTPAPPPTQPPAKLWSREKEYRKRHTLSEKTRLLRNLLPAEKKMEMATIYEETYKYIQFLKAQISALESMPAVSSSSSSNFRSVNPRYGGLEKLNRQQLLQVLVNSPAAQSVMYSKGCCIYSIEQLMLFKEIAEKSFFVSDYY